MRMTAACGASSLARRSSPRPSIRGIFRSVTMTATPSWMCCTADWPSATAITSKPSLRSQSAIASRLRRSSSTSKTFHFPTSVLSIFPSPSHPGPGTGPPPQAIAPALRGRQEKAEARAAADLRIESDPAAAVLDRPLDHCQAQAGPFRLGGEERLEDAGTVFLGDAATGVPHLDADLAAPAGFGPHGQRAAVRHGLAGVDDKVEQGAP